MNTNSLQFEDLDSWKMARALTNEVYALCRDDRLSREFALSDQLRRASLSIMNNISEGWERRHVGDKIRFYDYARGSCGEVRSMSYVLLDNLFISPADQTQLRENCIRSGKLISGLMRAAEARS